MWSMISGLTSGQMFRLQKSKFIEVEHQFLPQSFSLSSNLLDLEQPFCHHCVPFVKTSRMIPKLTLKGSISKSDLRTEVKSGQSWACYISLASEWWARYIGAIFICVSHLIQKLIGKDVFYPRLIYNRSGSKIDLTWGHENEKSDIYVL